MWIEIISAIALLATGMALLQHYDKNQKRKNLGHFLRRLSKLGSRYHMRFTSQEVLKECIIGLDGVRRKIIVISRAGPFASAVIDLNHVKSCSVKKQYGAIRRGGLKNRKLESYLESVLLHFECFSGKAVEVPFYLKTSHALHESDLLERKAKSWQAMLSKLLYVPTKEPV